MNILLVTTTFPPDTGWGGIATYVYHMSRGLAGRGHHVTVLCGYKDEERETVDGNLRIVRRIAPASGSWLERTEAIAPIIEEEIKRDRIDVVEFAEHSAEGLGFQRRNPSFPAVLKFHSPSRLCALATAPPWKAFLLRFVQRKVAREAEALERESAIRAHATVSPSKWLLAWLEQQAWELPPDPAVVANPLSDWSPEQNSVKDYAMRRAVLIGRLDGLKGAGMMPALFRAVWREAPDFCFELIGQSYDRGGGERWDQWLLRKLPARHRSQVILRGGLPYAQIPENLARHSMGVFLSRLESYSYTVAECMASGIGCVVASQGGAQELGEDGISVLNSPRNAQAVASRVLRLARDSELRRRIGEAARQRARAEFNADTIAAKMETIYALAMRRAGRAGA